MKFVRRIGVAVASAVLAVSVLGSAPAAADTSWGGKLDQGFDTSWGQIVVTPTDTSWGGR